MRERMEALLTPRARPFILRRRVGLPEGTETEVGNEHQHSTSNIQQPLVSREAEALRAYAGEWGMVLGRTPAVECFGSGGAPGRNQR